MSGQTIERGSVEHLRFIVEAHRGTLRMVNALVSGALKAIEAGEMDMAREELGAIEMVTRGYEKGE